MIFSLFIAVNFFCRLICYWLMNNYEPRYGIITFPDGQKMDVVEKDVEVCLGLPRGGMEIVKLPPLVNTGVLEDWRMHIGLPLHMIRHTDVSEAMLSDVSGGTSFIRDFLVLFHACLIEPLQSGAANQSLVRSLENVDDVGNWNWCGFVIKCLEDAKTKWDVNRAAPFTGPLIFVTVFFSLKSIYFTILCYSIHELHVCYSSMSTFIFVVYIFQFFIMLYFCP